LNEVVLDASVLVKWLRTDDERDRSEALRLQARFRAGELAILVPPLLFMELLNVAARRWLFSSEALQQLADYLASLAFVVRQPSLGTVALWTARGLTAYDACYLALAEERRTVVVTADEQILAVGEEFARSLGSLA
jgi:predicted nucleic acid-binding protein